MAALDLAYLNAGVHSLRYVEYKDNEAVRSWTASCC